MRSRKNLERVLAVLAVVAVVGAACSKKSTTTTPGGGGSSAGKQAVSLGFMGALTGAAAGLVVPGYQGAQLAVDQANAGKFGDLPVTITLVKEDTQGSATQAPPVATKIANDSSFVGVIGPAFSGESLAAGSILDGAGIPFVTASATNVTIPDQGWFHWFRANGNDNSQGPSAGEYLARVLKPNCAFIGSDDTPYGKALAQIAEGIVKGDGVKTVVDLGAVANGGTGQTKDFSALVTKIKSSGCTGAFYGGYSSEAPGLRKQMTEAGLQNVTLVGGDGIKDDTYTSGAGAAGDGTIATCPCIDITKSTSPDAASFTSDYTNKWGEPPGIYSAEYYDTARLYIEAFKQGNTTRDAITNFLDHVRFTGLTKTYSFQANHELDQAGVKIYIWKDENSSWTFLGQDKDVIPGCTHCTS